MVNRFDYVAPEVSVRRLSMESAFLAASEPVNEISKKNITVKVEDYESFENQITFEGRAL